MLYKILAFWLLPTIAFAAVSVPLGGTGSTTLSGILTGNGTSSVRTLLIGNNLSLSNNTLSASFTESDPLSLSLTGWFSTTTHAKIVSLPALSITKSQVSDFGSYEAPLTFSYPLSRSVNAVSVVATSTYTAPLVFSAGTNAVSCTTATASVPGCLTAADFTTFNLKQVNIGATTTNPFLATLFIATSSGTVTSPALTITDAGGLYRIGANSLGITNGVSGLTWNGTAFFPNTTNARNLGVISTNLWNNLYVNYASTTAITATSLDLTNLTFNGVTASTWAAFCSTITGGAGLCDGTDAGLTTAVTSLAGGTGLTGGTITTTGTLSLVSYLATSTADTGGQVMYWNTTNGTPAKISSVATSTQTLSAWFSSTGTMGNDVGGTSGTLSRIDTLQFTLGTSTQSNPLVGTSTIYIENVVLAETMQAVRCSANAGTAVVDIYQGSTHTLPAFVASSTNGQMTLTTNNTLAAGNLLKVDVGTPLNSVRYLQCTIKVLR